MKATRLMVTVASVIATLLSLSLYLFDKVTGRPVPLWTDVLLIYGVVFLGVLFFDSIGRQTVLLRRDKDAAHQRPTPQPTPTRRSALAASRVQAEAVRLLRATNNDEMLLQQMCDDAVAEVMALQGKLPGRDKAGHVIDAPVANWLLNEAFWTLFIVHHEEPVGCIVTERQASATNLRVVYVLPGMRRRGIGSIAVRRLQEALDVAAMPDALAMSLPEQNGRARRFFHALGFTEVTAADSIHMAVGAATMGKRMVTVVPMSGAD